MIDIHHAVHIVKIDGKWTHGMLLYSGVDCCKNCINVSFENVEEFVALDRSTMTLLFHVLTPPVASGMLADW